MLGIRPRTSKRGIWYVSFEPVARRTPGKQRYRATETFLNEQDAKAFAKARLSDSLNVRAGTVNPHAPKRTIGSAHLLDWIGELER